MTKYYSTADGRRLAMRKVPSEGGSGTLSYFANDHLGGTAVVMDASGGLVSRTRYYPYGNAWTQENTSPTDRLFTSQRRYGQKSGIYHYGARFYSADIGRFLSPDSIVPGAGDPQLLNRYSYVANNPLRYTDPSGHCIPEINCPPGLEESGRLVRTTKFFEGEWKVLIGQLGSGESAKSVKVRVSVRVTMSAMGSETRVSVNKEGSGLRVLQARVFYERGGPVQARLTGCSGPCLADRGYVGSATFTRDAFTAGEPSKIQLDLSRSADEPVGTYLQSDTLYLDLETGRTTQNTCIPQAAAYFNTDACFE